MIKNKGNIMYGNKETAATPPQPQGSEKRYVNKGMKQSIDITEKIRTYLLAQFINRNKKTLLKIYTIPGSKMRSI